MDPKAEEQRVKLTVARGPEEGATYEVDNPPIRIGRHPHNTIVIPDPYVSAMHGRIFRKDGMFIYEDLLSTNGSCILRGSDHIFLDQALKYRSPLENGDHLYLGFKKSPVILGFETGQPASRKLELVTDDTRILEAIPAESAGGFSPDEAFYGQAFAIVSRLSLELNTVLDLRSAIDTLGTAITELFRYATHVVILLRQGSEGKFGSVFSQEKAGREFVESRITVSRTVLRRVISRAESVLFSNASQDFDASASIVRAHLQSGICVPVQRAGAIVGLILVENRENPCAFSRKDLEVVSLIAQQTTMVIDRVLVYRELHSTFEQTIQSLAIAIEAKDRYTHGHSEMVADYCRMVAVGMGLPEVDVNLIVRASLMHDIGKIGVDYSILNKPEPLTPQEFEAVKNHPVIGKRIIEPIRFLQKIVPIVYHHHERFDGRGYPDGIAGDAIPLGARILAVADTFHAMTSDRAYRKGRDHQEAIDELRKYAGTQFDPKVVEVFVREFARRDAAEHLEAVAAPA